MFVQAEQLSISYTPVNLYVEEGFLDQLVTPCV